MKGFVKKTLAAAMVATFMLGSYAPVSAAAPTKEDVEYKGAGKVEVEFKSDVRYKNSSVAVKDTSGKTYKATIIKRGDDDMKFKIKNYKKGKTYKFTIKGVKKAGTKKYGKVKGTVKIPAATSSISKSKAKSIALNHANVKASQVRDYEIEKDTYRGTATWEISFDAKGYEWEYEINRSNGKILKWDKEYDD